MWGTKPKELQLKPVQLNESHILLRIRPGLHAQNNKISNLSENTTEIYPSSNQYDFCQSQRKLRISKHCNSWISSAMTMAMSISRTLCVLVFLVSPQSFLILGMNFPNICLFVLMRFPNFPNLPNIS